LAVFGILMNPLNPASYYYYHCHTRTKLQGFWHPAGQLERTSFRYNL